jgi:capsular polysaccharide biosynthesis protein
MAVRAAGTDAIGALRWGLRRYRVLFLLCVLIGVGIAPLAAVRGDTPTDAEALVIAERLQIDLSAVARFGEAVFNNGEVAGAVAAEFGNVTATDENIIPGRVSLIAEQDSIVFQVIGHDVDPETAAALANVAANAFIAALNEAGDGVGHFGLQSAAAVPSKPDSALGTVFALPVGLVAGAVLGLALVAAILVARRPVIEGGDAEEITGVPTLGTVTVPRTRRGQFAKPQDFAGLVPVCRRLLALPTPTVVLVSRPRDQRVRFHLTVALVKVLGLIGDIRFIGPGNQGMVAVEEPPTGTGRDGARMTLVDGSDVLTVVQPPHTSATVLVAPVGIRSASLRAAVVEHLGGSAEARILLVKRGQRVQGTADPGVGPTPGSRMREPAPLADSR